MMERKIKIDIVSDVVCPWCYIGRHRLEKAIQESGSDTTFEISWKPYQLHPDMPKGGAEREAFMQRKFGDQGSSLSKYVQDAAISEGMEMNFDQIPVIPNTMEAHRLMWFARQEGKEEALAIELFKAYFTHAENVEDSRVLAEKAREAGVSEAAIEKFLNTHEGEEEVRYEESEYRRAGISAVPSFIINDKYLVQGAQPPEVFHQVFEKVAPPTISGSGESCEGDQCAV